MGQPRKRRSFLKILLLAAALAVAAEVLSLAGLDTFSRGSRVFNFLGLFHDPSMRLVDRLMPDYFDYPDEVTDGQQFLGVVILYGLPTLQWFCIFVPGVYVFRGSIEALKRSRRATLSS